MTADEQVEHDHHWPTGQPFHHAHRGGSVPHGHGEMRWGPPRGREPDSADEQPHQEAVSPS